LVHFNVMMPRGLPFSLSVNGKSKGSEKETALARAHLNTRNFSKITCNEAP
jgi:hypothetical protein